MTAAHPGRDCALMPFSLPLPAENHDRLGKLFEILDVFGKSVLVIFVVPRVEP